MGISKKTGLSLALILFLLSAVLAGCCLFPKSHARYERRITRKMTVTAYDAGPESCGWRRKYWCIGPPVYAYGPLKGKRKEVGITSDGTRAKKGTLAADIKKYPYGTKMYVPGYGWGEVHDTGRAIKGNHIDVFFSSRKKALEWGKQYLEVIVLLPE